LAQHVDVQITIEGEQISPFSNILISQSIHGHHTFEVVLPVDAFESSTREAFQKHMNHIGKRILFRFGPKVFEKKQTDNEFIGLITHVGASRHENGERSIVLRGSSPTILMEGNLQCRSYSESSLKGISSALLENIPTSLETEIQPIFKGSIPYVVQYNESNYAFLQRLAARYGEWCFYNGTKLVFGKLPKTAEIDLPFAGDLYNFNFSIGLKPVNSKAIAYNYMDDTIYQSTASTATVPDVGDFGRFTMGKSEKLYAQEAVYNPGDTFVEKKELNAFVEQQKTSVAREMVVATGDSDNPYLNTGVVINITGETLKEQDYGKFVVTSVTHRISGTYSYHNEFTAIPAENQTPPLPAISKPSGDNQLAVVTDNADPEGLGRVRAQFFWQQGSEKTPWMRVANTMAGQGKGDVHGFYFIPEIHDQVLVGFEDNNPDKPFVIGSLYHKNVAPTEWKDTDRDNQIKVIRTRNGNQIYLLDKDGKEEIKILNTKVGEPTNIISLSMEGDGKITIQTKGELVMKAKSIDIQAEEGIQMKSGKATDIKAQELTVKADQAIKMNSGQATEIKAMEMKVNADSAIKLKSQQMDIDSTTAKIKAAAQLSIEGAQSSIKASMLQIDGGATASVKAGIIQLN
jgi:uncharacterized protein involved in type VI secretion and phage assembly